LEDRRDLKYHFFHWIVDYDVQTLLINSQKSLNGSKS
jgi:hypothetical protein